ncbi:hypothetical protein LOE37_10355 [Pseudosulfitobacter pseudonitzschiae]|nr:hypothetical protein [Pseudosulfitobacter pseudonitzschiae]UFE45553.1 hypothetical protein LOE37_10355 [Pseudosulfitobacter pseudonitzschiae]UFF41584.1 hypothetical protein LOE11_01965 [Pseudosulfitobacter pseudonitzschiae]
MTALADVYPDLMPADEAAAILPAETRDFNWVYLQHSSLIKVERKLRHPEDMSKESTVEILGVRITASGIDLLRKP